MAAATVKDADPLAANYGDVELKALQSSVQLGRVWTKVRKLGAELDGQNVLIRGRAQTVRAMGNLGFIVVREATYTVQCVASVSENVVSKQMIKFIASISKDSIIDVEGVVQTPPEPIAKCTQQVEIEVRKVFCVNKASPVLPLNVVDAARNDIDLENADKEGKPYPRVGQDTRMKNRVIKLRTPANQAIFRIQSEVCMLFHEYLKANKFKEIHTPKLLPGASEGGSSVFPLAQSPQLPKQMLGPADDTDFYILHRYPLALQPFYTMPAADDPRFTNSFDVFIRGEEIILGAQHIQDLELLIATECEIDVKNISSYIDSFSVNPSGRLRFMGRSPRESVIQARDPRYWDMARP